MDLRRVLALAAALVVQLASSRAHAWQEAREVGDDAEVHVDANGMALVEHTLRWHVVRGPLKAVELVNVDPSASLEPDVRITGEDGHEFSGHAVRQDDKSVRVVVDQPRALMRGTFAFALRWHLDLARSHAIERDGPTWRLTLSAPVANEGLDGARTVIDVPSAPDEPKPILAETGAVDDGAVSALRRESGRDVLELVQPHVARGEAASFTLRLDPRALPGVMDPRLRPPADLKTPSEPDRVREAALATSFCGLALAFGLLVAAKGAAFECACEGHGARARAMIPLPLGARATLAGAALAAAVGLEASGLSTAGGLLVAIAMLAGALRSPLAKRTARGPGRWLALRPDDAFAPDSAAGHWLDIDAPRGKATALLGAALVLALALLTRRWSSHGSWLVSLDAAALAPLFVTGRSSQLPPDGARSAAPWLARAFRYLRTKDKVRVVPWARVVVDASTVEELRLLVLPRVAMPGVVGIELGLAWCQAQTGWIAAPELLVRVLESSAAASKLSQTSAGSRTVTGRRPDERVVRLAPRSPTLEGAVALTCAIADLLTDRRMTLADESWAAGERRKERAVQWAATRTC
jgi:hypothetical protein